MARRLRVLSVDDSDAVRNFIAAVLTQAGCEVWTADGVLEGLRILETDVPDLILTDYRMPGLLRTALVSFVRSDPRFGQTPILMISSEDDPTLMLETVLAGANGWVPKPLEVAALLAAGSSVCSQTGAWSVHGDRSIAPETAVTQAMGPCARTSASPLPV